MVNKLHIWDSVSTSQKRNHTTITVYVLGRTGRSLLRMLHCFARDSQSFSINNHNMQATATLIQALYASYFKAQALGNNNSSLLFSDHKLSVASSLGSVFNLSSFDVLFQSESPLKPVVSRANDAFFLKNADKSRLPELLADAILVGGVTDKKLHSSLGSRANTPLKPKSSDDGSSWFDSTISFFQNHHLAHQINIFKPFLPNSVNDDADTLRLISSRFGEGGARSNSLYCPKHVLANILCGNWPFILPFLRLFSINNVPKQQFLKAKYYLDMFGYCLNNISNCFSAFSPVLSLSSYSLSNANNLNNAINISSSTSNVLSVGSKRTSSIYKPIGLLPYEVSDSLDDRIQQTYLALSQSRKPFTLDDIDIRPFNEQFGLNPVRKQEGTDTPFEADTMLTFKHSGKIHRVFIELDNRTERNRTQVQKILNYIAYANKHPDEKILLAIVATDGSLASPNVKGFVYPDRHLGSLVDKLLHTQIGITPESTPEEVKHAPFLKYSYYNRCNNLKLIFAGVSEAPMRIAEFILDANHNADYLCNAIDLANQITKQTPWEVSFTPTISVANAMKNPRAFVDADFDSPHFVVSDVFGYFHYRHTQTGLKLVQPVVAGDEYDFDTPDTVLFLTKKFDKKHVLQDNDNIPPVVIYPTRERITHPIVVSTYWNRFNWSKSFTVGQPYFYQPRLGLDNNPFLLRELRALIIRHSKNLYDYFSYGYLTKSDLKANTQYGNDFLSLSNPNIVKKPRSYDELHALTNYMNEKAFAEQLMITEVPIGIFKALIKRNQGLVFSIPAIADLPYSVNGDHSLVVPKHVSLTDCLTTPNSFALRSRRHIDLKNCY